jgi:hypothetical protein
MVRRRRSRQSPRTSTSCPPAGIGARGAASPTALEPVIPAKCGSSPAGRLPIRLSIW